MSSNFQKTCKNKFGSLKNCTGSPQFFTIKKNAAGGVKYPTPSGIGLNDKYWSGIYTTI